MEYQELKRIYWEDKQKQNVVQAENAPTMHSRVKIICLFYFLVLLDVCQHRV